MDENDVEIQNAENAIKSRNFWKGFAFVLILMWILDPIIDRILGWHSYSITLDDGSQIRGQMKLSPTAIEEMKTSSTEEKTTI
jgi:hypothetical protein